MLWLTDDGGVLWSVEGADDDEAESFVLLAMDDDIAGLQAAALQGRGCHVRGASGAEAWGRVAPRGAVLGGDGARAAAVHWTSLTWGDTPSEHLWVVVTRGRAS